MKLSDEGLQKEAINLTKELIRIPSYLEAPGRETRIQNFILEWGKKQGLETEEYILKEGVPLVLLGLKGKEKNSSILFNGHTDTVNIDNMSCGLEPIVEGNWLQGRGAADMKGGLAAMLMAVALLHREGFIPNNDIYVAAVPGEEKNNGQIGSRYIAENMKGRFKYCVIGEPTDLSIGSSTRGMYILRVCISIPIEKAPHPGLASSSDNAMNAYVDFVTLSRNKISGYFQPDDVSIDTDKGKLLPFYVESYFVRKTLPGECYIFDKLAYEEIAYTLAKLYPNMTLDFELKDEEIMPMQEPKNKRIVQAAIDSFYQESGIRTASALLGIATDGRILREAGIDTIIFGPVGTGYHSSNERVYIPSLIQLTKVYKRIAESISNAN